ncbi:MAG: nucleotidyl transferase AbiEii/AbiGii toxin family protein [Kiritimatiellae bacterium]|jgi:hypothetical protein|nr:nucleotidyl transferase AbiEii/AbiGii toxin family protein [Kiritimatiellia bacterium]
MISGSCYTREYLETQQALLERGDLNLLDKCIHALALLCNLTQTGIPFLFKGGTSLLLHLPKIKRLSIDIDIISPVDGATLEAAVNQLSTMSPFVRHEEDERRIRGVPARRHFKFFYPSAATGNEEYVLLDVVLEKHCTLAAIEKPVRCEFLKMEGDVNVQTPTLDALLGDKLTAFAPHTIGVPFQTDKGLSRTMQVVKQLYDIGELFNEISDLAAVKVAYEGSFHLENGYHDGRYSMTDALKDTKHVALQICLDGVRGGNPDALITDQMKDGVGRLRDHLIRDRLRWNIDVKIMAAKAYLLAAYVGGELELPPERLRYSLSNEILDFIRSYDLPHLNSLKQTVPEAFYYLALAMAPTAGLQL